MIIKLAAISGGVSTFGGKPIVAALKDRKTEQYLGKMVNKVGDGIKKIAPIPKV